MSIILDQDIYKWLIGLDMIKMSAVARHLPEGKVELDPSVTSYFSTGLLFSRLITKIVKNIAKTTNISHVNLSSLDGMKFSPSAASLTHNWNIIVDVLRQLNIQIDHDVKHLIVNGDHDMLIEVLKDMHSHFRPKHIPYSSQGGNRARSSSRDRSSSVESPSKGSGKGSPSPFKARKFETDAIDIEKVKANKDLKSTNTVLEFFLVSLSKHLSLTPKQAVTLLTNGFKYLAHVQAKGVKGVFEPVSYWYQDVYAHTDHLITLIEKDKENNVNLVQQACRPGLLSKSSEVVEWTCRLFSKMALEFTNRNLMPMAWEWFVSDHGGMQGCLMGLKRHPSLAESVISVLVQYSRYDMIDLFTIHLKNICPDVKDQVHMMLLLYKPLSESNFTRDEIVNSGVLDSWIATVVKFIENDSGIDTETRLSCLSLMCDVWLSHPGKIEEQDEVSAAVLNSLKKTARDKSRPVALNTISLLFKLLDQFTTGKNNYAAIIYKTLTFSVVENYASITTREFILRNFKVLFESNQSIPIGVLLEPLLKHMQTDDLTSSTINVFDLEFFTVVIKHSKFNDSYALPLFYVLADVYLNNIAFSKESHKLIIEILSAHLKSESLQEAVHRFIKASLAMFYSSEKNKRPKQKQVAPYFNQMPVTKPVPVAELESETLKAQKRAMIIQILRSIIGLQNNAVNQRAKTFILYTHVQLKTQLKTEHKGILSLISLFGDASSIIAQFEKDMKSSKLAEGGIDFNSDQTNFRNDMAKSPESDAINFLKGAGSGQKKKNLNTSELSMKKLPKPDPKVEEELGMIQREVQQKKMKRIEEENIEKEKIEKQKKKLKDQLDKRKIELGVASKNQKNAEENIIFDEGSRELEKLLEKKHGLPEIELVDLDDEEERDKEAVQIFLKKYHKILHHLFMTYANVGFSTQDSSSFSKIADKNSVINLPDIYKMLNDHDCTKYCSKEEVNTLVRLINTQFQDRHDLKTLNFLGFKDFFVQFAIFAFSRPPKDLSHMPIFVSVEALLQIFRNATLAKGKSVLLYDDPNSTEVGDKDLHAFLNEALSKDAEYPLPEAYKKVVEKSAKFTYQLPASLEISDSYKDCYEILEDIVNAAFRIRLTEPIVTFDAIPKAKLKVYDPTKIEYSSDHHLKPIGSTKKLTKNESVDVLKRRVLNAENRPKISLELKKEVASFPYKDRALAQEVAEVLEGVLQLVEEGKTSLEKEKASLKARQKEAKEKEKEELQKQEEASEQRRRQRAEEIKTLLKDHKTTKEEPKKQKSGEISSPNKRKDEERMKYLAEQKEKAKAFKEKKEEEKKMKEEEEERKKRQEEEDKKRNFKTFNQQKVENMSKKFDEVKNKRQEEEAKKKSKEEEEKRKKADRERNMKDIIEKDKENREKQREITSRIKQLVRDSGMKKTFEKYEKELQTVYRYYIDSVHLSIGTGKPLETLPFQGYAAFAMDFNIFPGIISLAETKALYNSITLDKKVEQGVPLGITYEEFLESLMRIAIKGKEKLNRIYSIKSRLREAKDKDAYNRAEDDMRREREDDEGNGNENEYEYNNNQDDQYEEIEGTTKNTLEGLLLYLDMPQDKATLVKKMKVFKEERPKNWKEKKNYWKKDLIEGGGGSPTEAFPKVQGDLDRESIMNDGDNY